MTQTPVTAQKIAFIQARWHADIVDQARIGLMEALPPGMVVDVIDVPGALEIPLIAQRLARTGATGIPPTPEACPGEAQVLMRLSSNPAQARKWATAAQDALSRARHGRAVNLDPAALVLDTLFTLQKSAA